MVLIQNKIDLIDKAVITNDEATALADKVRRRLSCALVFAVDVDVDNDNDDHDDSDDDDPMMMIR
jgi:hypothetical protein